MESPGLNVNPRPWACGPSPPAAPHPRRAPGPLRVPEEHDRVGLLRPAHDLADQDLFFRPVEHAEAVMRPVRTWSPRRRSAWRTRAWGVLVIASSPCSALLRFQASLKSDSFPVPQVAWRSIPPRIDAAHVVETRFAGQRNCVPVLPLSSVTRNVFSLLSHSQWRMR